MADNIANIPSSVADSTPQETLGAAYTAASGTLRFTGAAKPTYWPSTPYRVTVFDSTNGDITFRISVDSSWPNVTAAVVEGSDHNLASGASAEHLGPLTAGGFDDRADSRATTLDTTHDGAATVHAAATNLVHIGGTETVTGAKTFSAVATFGAGIAVTTGTVAVTANGSVTAAAFSVGSGGYGLYKSSSTVLALTVNSTQVWTGASTAFIPKVRFQADAGIGFPLNNVATGTTTLVQATSRFNQIVNYAAGSATVNLPLGSAAITCFYRFSDPFGYLAAGNTLTIAAQDPGGVGGGQGYDTLNGVRGGTQLINAASQVWEVYTVGSAVDDLSGDLPRTAYYIVRIA